MSDYIVLIQEGQSKRIRQVERIEIDEGCIHFWHRDTLLAVFTVANIIGFYRD